MGEWSEPSPPVMTMDLAEIVPPEKLPQMPPLDLLRNKQEVRGHAIPI